MQADTIPPPLDEMALRGSKFRPGFPTVLGDGQLWQVPRPKVVWVPADGEPGYEAIFDFDDAHRALLANLESVHDRDDLPGIVAAEMRLYGYILRQNYTLDTPALRRLIRLDFGDDPSPESVAIHRVFRAAATGAPLADEDREQEAAEPGTEPEATADPVADAA